MENTEITEGAELWAEGRTHSTHKQGLNCSSKHACLQAPLVCTSGSASSQRASCRHLCM